MAGKKNMRTSWNTQTKYKNTKITTSDGIFDSKKEYRRWQALKQMESDGVISELGRQVKYELIPSQKLPTPVIHKGKKRLTERAVTYSADFVYTKDGRRVVEDVKGGILTPEYIIKRKLMLWKYGIQVIEV